MAACDLDTLVSQDSCFDCESDSEKNHAYLYLLAKTLAAKGGTDYSDIDTLRNAVACYCGLGSRLQSLKSQVALGLAVRAGAYASNPSKTSLNTATVCWNCGIGADEMRAMEVFLLCNLFNNLVP